MVERLFLAVPRGCLRFVIVVSPERTHLLFLILKRMFAIDTQPKQSRRQTHVMYHKNIQ